MSLWIEILILIEHVEEVHVGVASALWLRSLLDSQNRIDAYLTRDSEAHFIRCYGVLEDIDFLKSGGALLHLDSVLA